MGKDDPKSFKSSTTAANCPVVPRQFSGDKRRRTSPTIEKIGWDIAFHNVLKERLEENTLYCSRHIRLSLRNEPPLSLSSLSRSSASTQTNTS